MVFVYIILNIMIHCKRLWSTRARYTFWPVWGPCMLQREMSLMTATSVTTGLLMVCSAVAAHSQASIVVNTETLTFTDLLSPLAPMHFKKP